MSGALKHYLLHWVMLLRSGSQNVGMSDEATHVKWKFKFLKYFPKWQYN